VQDHLDAQEWQTFIGIKPAPLHGTDDVVNKVCTKPANAGSPLLRCAHAPQ
jgi:hypothetical protein